MGGNLELIDTLIASQVRAIRWQLALAAVLLVVGLLAAAFGTFSQQLNSISSKSWIVTVFGVLASSLSAFPVKDLIMRREKTDALRMLKARIADLERRPATDRAEIEQISSMLWASVKTIIER